MVLYYNKSGQLLEFSNYGQYPRVGSNDIQIFAYFENIDLDEYPYALIRFKRPDLQGSEYPDLFMLKSEITYNSGIARSGHFINGQKYKGFVFDFSKVKDSDGSIIMLDTPGMWEASITLISVENAFYNVQGIVRFNVSSSVSWVDDNPMELDYSVITHNVAEALSNVLFKNEKQYVRAHDNFTEAASAGTLLKAIYVPGSLVYDETKKKMYVINTVSDSQINGRVTATYTHIGPFGSDIEASPTNNLKIINPNTEKFELRLTDVLSEDEISDILNGDNSQ